MITNDHQRSNKTLKYDIVLVAETEICPTFHDHDQENYDDQDHNHDNK